MLPDTDASTALEVMGRLRSELARRMAEDEWPVTFSTGLGIFDRAGLSPGEIVKACVTLMYAVKSKGKNDIAWQLFTGPEATPAPDVKPE